MVYIYSTTKIGMQLRSALTKLKRQNQSTEGDVGHALREFPTRSPKRGCRQYVLNDLLK